MASDADCIFCKIVKGQIPATTVLDTPSTLAFLDIRPLAPGHTLVIPKAHYETLLEVPPEALSALSAELPRLARAILKAVDAPALTVACNNGREAGQEIDHVHFHLIPRREGDRLVSSAPGQAQEESARKDIRDRIVAALEKA